MKDRGSSASTIDTDTVLPHLTDGELVGYLDNDLPDDERRRVVEHLDACDACRSEAVETARLLGQDWNQVPNGQVPIRRWRWGIPAGIAGIAAAATLAAVLLVQPAIITRSDEAADQERFITEGVGPLAAHHPSHNGAVARDDLRFAWADAGTESYKITVTAEDGRPVWSQTLVDTTVVPPATVDLEPGERFFWYVDAMSAGVVARTGARSFVVTP
jgi:hypothetical protein